MYEGSIDLPTELRMPDEIFQVSCNTWRFTAYNDLSTACRSSGRREYHIHNFELELRKALKFLILYWVFFVPIVFGISNGAIFNELTTVTATRRIGTNTIAAINLKSEPFFRGQNYPI